MDTKTRQRVETTTARHSSRHGSDLGPGSTDHELARARDAAERATHAKSDFLAAASHDLRQPLQTLALLNSALTRTLPPDSRAASIVVAQEAAIKTMSELIDALLDIGKLEAGAVEPEFRECSIREIFARLRAEFGALAQAKGLELIVDDTELAVRTDPTLLTRVIQNLLANAVRYTTRGSVRLRSLPSQGGVRIEVLDTGVGIPESELDLIFDEYYRSAGAKRGSREGVGLGLAIARRVADLLGCSIAVLSTPGKGSCFMVTVPFAGDAMRPVETRPASESPAVTKGALVVVVDDDASVADATAMLLTAADFDVVPSASSAEALSRLGTRRDEVDLLICDYRLGPGEDGISAIDRLRHAIGRLVPAILISGDTSARLAGLGSEVALCKVLRKPVDADELLALSARLTRLDPTSSGSPA